MKTDNELWAKQIQEELSKLESKYLLKVNGIFYKRNIFNWQIDPIEFLNDKFYSLHFYEIPTTSTIEVYELLSEGTSAGVCSIDFQLIKTIKFEKPKTHAQELRELLSDPIVGTSIVYHLNVLANKWEDEERQKEQSKQRYCPSCGVVYPEDYPCNCWRIEPKTTGGTGE